MSEDIPVAPLAPFDSQPQHVAPELYMGDPRDADPFTHGDFAKYRDMMRYQIGDPTAPLSEEARFAQKDALHLLDRASQAAADRNSGETPDQVVQGVLTDLINTPAGTPEERAQRQGEVAVITDLWEMMGDSNLRRNMRRAIRDHWRAEEERANAAAGATGIPSPPTAETTPLPGGMTEEEVRAAAEQPGEFTATSEPVKTTSTQTTDFDREAAAAARNIVAGSGSSPQPQPEGGLSAADIERMRNSLPTPTTASEQTAKLREAKLPPGFNPEHASPDELLRVAKSYLDQLATRYGREPLKTREEWVAALNATVDPFNGDPAAKAQEIRNFALTPNEGKALHTLWGALAPEARAGNADALNLQGQLKSTDSIASLRFDDPARIQEVLARIGFRPEQVEYYVGLLNEAQAKQRPGDRKRTIAMTFQRDASTPDPRQGKIIDTPMVGL